MKRIHIVTIFLFGLLSAQGGGNALEFDGVDDIVNCGTDTSLNIQDMLTIEVWIRSPESNSYARIVDRYDFFQHQGFNLVRYPEMNSAMLDFYSTVDTKHTYGGYTPVFDNNWHYVAATFDSINIRIYIDGRLEEHAVLPEGKRIQLCPRYLAIGNGFDGATWFPFHGIIDEVRLWNTALDSATIRDWMHKRLSPEHPRFSHLAGYWTFNEGQGSIAGDSSGFQNDGVITGMDTTSAWINSTVPLAESPVDQLLNVSAIWASRDSASSSILSIQDTSVTGDACVIFAHNGEDLTWNSSDIPENSGILNRIKRTWQVEVYDTLSATLIFDVSGLDMTDGNALCLLIDDDGDFSNADTAHGIYNPVNNSFTIPNQNLQFGNYYTIGTEESMISNVTQTPTAPPKRLLLSQNYPNPFNPETQFYYTLPNAASIEINLYNISGQKVKVLYNGFQSAGEHRVKIRGDDLSSGLYFYEIKTPTKIIRKKCILLR